MCLNRKMLEEFSGAGVVIGWPSTWLLRKGVPLVCVQPGELVKGKEKEQLEVSMD